MREGDREKGALTWWHCDAVALGVEHSADLRQFAISLDDILDGRGLHEECIAALAFHHPVHPLHVAAGEHRRPRGLHKRPHPLIGGKIRVLKREGGRQIECITVFGQAGNNSVWPNNAVLKYRNHVGAFTVDHCD